MKRILVAALSVLLCVQNVYAMPVSNPVEYTEENTAAEESVAEEENTSEEESTTEENISEQSGGIGITAPSAILMEASTGQIIYEKDADNELPPASVTKIMTLLLIFDALEAGKIQLTDEVTTSEYAASMGGSQVFLEVGETQTVETMIKCIAVASANDACVAMAEHISGNEDEFVNQMNQRAESLGMNNTHFVNCNGLDTDGHLTTAHDIALMSRELISKYPQIHDYSMIWMENITHTTSKGSSEFRLTNTNKLVRQYQYATGLKTGSTDKAKFCVSATAEKDGIELIAVIMAAPDPKGRFQDAVTLLNYGFGKCNKYTEESTEKLSPVTIKGGIKDTADVTQTEAFTYIDTTGADLSTIEKKVSMNENLKAPVKKGDKAGEIRYYIGDAQIGAIDIVTTEAVEKTTYKSSLTDSVKELLL